MSTGAPMEPVAASDEREVTEHNGYRRALISMKVLYRVSAGRNRRVGK